MAVLSASLEETSMLRSDIYIAALGLSAIALLILVGGYFYSGSLIPVVSQDATKGEVLTVRGIWIGLVTIVFLTISWTIVFFFRRK